MSPIEKVPLLQILFFLSQFTAPGIAVVHRLHIPVQAWNKNDKGNNNNSFMVC